MLRLAAVGCLLAACSFEHGNLAMGDAPPGISDGRPIDVTPRDGCVTFSTHVDTCALTATPGGAIVLTGMNTYNTDTQTLTTPGGDMILPTQVIVNSDGGIVAILVSSFTLQAGATLRATGPNNDRPLGIVAFGAVQIDGAIDLTDNGAGARNDTLCIVQKGHPGENDNGGGGGGGGAAFAAAGGGGANGDKDMNTDGDFGQGGAGGLAVSARPAHVIGGCDGGPGGNGSSTNAGNGGDGGGAIFIASAVSITINGSINAGGGGGSNGNGNGGGGGGGGSGGMIVLESSTIKIPGKIAANGGAGGEGADGNQGNPGETGKASAMAAVGGHGNAAEGGDAEDGGAGSAGAGVTATQFKNGGGGGGGGGVGFIGIGPATPMTSSGTIVSPPYLPWP